MPGGPFTLFPNDFNIGKDVSGRIFDDTGVSRNLAEIGHLLMFGVELKDSIVKTRPISNGGINLFETLWEGCDIHLRFTRARGNIEYITMQAMANFFALDLRPNYSISWSILDRNGTVDTFLATGLKLTSPNLGSFSGDKDVEQELRFTGQQGQWVGPNQPQLGASTLSF
jgi:hypothetical protein